jgi:hypothetical protein
MVAQDRRSGSRSWIPGLLATFWVLLAGLSGAYLFYIFTNPDARRVERALASQGTAPNSGDTAGDVSAGKAAALTDAIAAKDREIATLKSEIRDLSSQVAAFDGRLKPIEKVLGPVAALPSSTAVTTSPPMGTPMEAPAAAEPVEAPKPSPSAAAPKPPEAAPPQPAEAAPKPQPVKPAATPPGQAASAPKPVEPTKPAAAPAEETAAVDTQEPPTPTQKPPARAASPAVPAENAAEASEQGAAPDQAAEEPGAPDQDQSTEPSAPAETSTETPASPESTGEVAALAAPNIPPGTTRFGIELGTVDKQDGVRPMWRNLLTNHAALVAGLQARRIIAPDKKWRLIAGPFSSAAEALQACTLFKKASMPCEATVFAGDSL